MFSQLVYTLLTLIPAALCFHFYWLHVLLLGVMCAASAWNGGGYYRQVYITAKHSGSPAVPAIVATSVPEPRRRRN